MNIFLIFRLILTKIGITKGPTGFYDSLFRINKKMRNLQAPLNDITLKS